MSRHRPELKRTPPHGSAPRQFLVVCSAVSPLGSGEDAATATGLCRALTHAGHQVKVFTLVSPEQAARTSWLARRLRTVRLDGQPGGELAVYEGRNANIGGDVVAVAVAAGERSVTAATLRDGVLALLDDGLLHADIVIACGEIAALAAAEIEAPTRLMLLPDGRLGPALTSAELRDAGLDVQNDLTLAKAAAPRMTAVLAPGATAAIEIQQKLNATVLPLRLGCDEPPNDPASDPALPAVFSRESLGGKAECRRALARRLSLALGPRTLLLTTVPLNRDAGGEAVIATLPRLATLDVVVLIPATGDVELLERARVAAVEHPGRLVVLREQGDAVERQFLAAADALLMCDLDDHSGRAAGMAQLYGALPIAPDRAAYHDQLVDLEPRSGTGTAVLYESPNPFEIEGAIRRAIALRLSNEWSEITAHLMQSAPRWTRTAGAILQLCNAEDETAILQTGE